MMCTNIIGYTYIIHKKRNFRTLPYSNKIMIIFNTVFQYYKLSI